MPLFTAEDEPVPRVKPFPLVVNKILLRGAFLLIPKAFLKRRFSLNSYLAVAAAIGLMVQTHNFFPQKIPLQSSYMNILKGKTRFTT